MQNLNIDDDDDDDFEVADGESVRTPLFLTDTVRFENHQPHFVRATAGVDLDLADHQPGFRYATDAARAAVRDARQEMIDKATSAWRTRRRRKDDDDDDDDDGDRYKTEVMGAAGQNETNPSRIGVSSLSVRSWRGDDARSIADARAAVTRSYHQMCRRLQDAWKSGPMDASQPDTGSSLAEIRAHERGEPPESAMLRRHLSTEASAGAQAKRDAAWNAYKDRISRAYLQGRTDPRAATQIERQGERWRGGR
jgi:hypothetical protein